jgi:starch synthase
MHILHIATELASIVKTGGLGDVTYGLCKELKRQGHEVQILLPKYDSIQYNHLRDLRVYYKDLWSYDGANRFHNTVWAAEAESLSILLLEADHPEYLFNRGTVYGCADDIHRFLYFSRAAIEFLFKSGLRPDILHLHDWPVALIPTLQKDMYAKLGFAPIKTVLTLHNIEHQGRCFIHELSNTGLNPTPYLDSHVFEDSYDPKMLNLLKAGIVYSDTITTVSPTYKKEILEAKNSFGLHTTLQENSDKFYGILNGIDEDFWNPEIDPHLTHPFPAHPPFSKTNW